MYKYIRYIGITLFTVFRKYFGLIWFWVAVPFRGYARNVVYNYVLQNGIYLKRLLERPIVDLADGWAINPYHGADGGYIRYRKVSKIEYYFVYWFIWGWLDDDSNEDTYDAGHNRTIFSGERMNWLPNFIKNKLKKQYNAEVLYGNSFDLGDKRAEYSAFEFWSTLIWTWRNTAYNFKYMQWEENRSEMLFYEVIGSWHFGYLPGGKDKGRLVIGKFE